MATPWNLPVGLIFKPTDEEIVSYYLAIKVFQRQNFSWNPISDCDHFYDTEPWHLPGANNIRQKGRLLFYVPTKRKTANGSRVNRIAGNGFWKATSGDHEIGTIPCSAVGNMVSGSSSAIGVKKALTYHEYLSDDKNQRSSKSGKKTNWIMYEYRFITQAPSSRTQEMLFQQWTICKISYSGRKIAIERSIGPSDMVAQPQQSHQQAEDWLDGIDDDELVIKLKQQTEGDNREAIMAQPINSIPTIL